MVIWAWLVGAASCGTPIPWGDGVIADDFPAAGIDPAGLVVIVGPEGLETASARIDAALQTRWEDGLTVSATATVEASPTRLTLHLDALPIDAGPTQISIREGRLEATIGIAIEATPVALDLGLTPLCTPMLSADALELTLSVTLSADKRGRVRASVLPGAPTRGGEELITLTWSGCPEGVVPIEDVEGAIVGALVEASAAALSADVVDELPAALGLGLAFALTATVASEPSGAGVVRLAVRAAEDARAEGGWYVAGTHLVIPFRTGIDGENHPCVPEAALPEIVGSAVPSLTLDNRGLLLSHGLLVRTIAVSWASGAVCAGQATRGIVLSAGELAGHWAPLSRFDPATRVRLRVWPGAVVDTNVDGDSGTLTLRTGAMDVDVMAELDGAQVRLATVRASVRAVLRPGVTSEGGLTFGREALEVTGIRAVDGLVKAPHAANIEGLLAPFAERAITALVPIQLPIAVTEGTTPRIEFPADYLLIAL